jgi:hypothetical protein
MQNQEATARMLVVVNNDGTQIGIADENGHSQKLHLHIRRHNIEMELVKMHLPNDAKGLMQMALDERRRGLEGKYNLVCIWVKAQSRGPFWKKFDCRTLDELLAKLDLPNGMMLGKWEVLVKLFDKETFVLAGDETLGYMTALVGQYQKGAKQGLVAFQEIFDAYCGKYQAFDKANFCRIVNWYVNTKFLKPEESTATAEKSAPKSEPHGLAATSVPSTPRLTRTEMLIRDDPFRKPPSLTGETTQSRREPVAREDNQKCPHCEQMKFFRQIALEHITRLETVIEQNLGKGSIPPRPKILEW